MSGLRCAVEGCTAVPGRNGLGCHEHFTRLVPGFLARALFARHDEFTRGWLRRQVVHALRGEPWSA